ncbi:MAG: FtsX-like permease family protein, partial [Planctomycetes bacterium]|nr:FtsX-like permease family protein [Planctomycetota bacterium]
ESLPGARMDDVMEGLEAKTGATPIEEPGYATVIVRVDRLSRLAAVEDRIRRLGYETENALTQIDQVRRAFIILDGLLGALGGVALLIASLGIVNTQLMSVLERTREIAIHKTLGASVGDVRTIFLAESAVVGLIGGVGGTALALVTSGLLGALINAYLERQGMDEPLTVFIFPTWLLGGAILFTIGVSIISGLFPANRAARVDPATVLRGN